MTTFDQSTILPRETIMEWFGEMEQMGFTLEYRSEEYDLRATAENDLCIFRISAGWPGEFPDETRGYLGCIASAKDGGGNDLHDGVQNRETWERILQDIQEFSQAVQDDPTPPLFANPVLQVYPVESQRRPCTAREDYKSNADFYLYFRKISQEDSYQGFFCKAHWQDAIRWVVEQGV